MNKHEEIKQGTTVGQFTNDFHPPVAMAPPYQNLWRQVPAKRPREEIGFAIQQQVIQPSVPKIRDFLDTEMRKRGFDEVSKDQKKISEELQKCLIQYFEHYAKQNPVKYVYVWYEFGGQLPPDNQIEIKAFLKREVKGEDCVGSINNYCNRLNGFLLLDSQLFEALRAKATLEFGAEEFQIVENESDAAYRVHDKWGRAESFILFK